MSSHLSQGPNRRAVLAAGVGAAAVTAVASSPAAAGPGPVARPAPHARQAAGKAPAGRWDRFNLSPRDRTVHAVAVHTTTGAVDSPEALLPGSGAPRARLGGTGASVTLDFGREVGGFVSLGFASTSSADQTVGLTYSEMSTYVSATASDGSNGGTNDEPPVLYAVPRGGTVSTERSTPTGGTDTTAPPRSQLRGGFRYLTISNHTAGSVDLTEVRVHITFAPGATDLAAYPNYFHCDDDLLNRVWYAGAYTVQTNIIACDQGRMWGPPAVGWNNAATVGEAGATVLVDGAKRDRTIWPGDLGISVLTDYVSLGDLETVRNSLLTLYRHQADSGALPYAGPAVNFIGDSDTYHLWTLIGTALYAQLSADTSWVATVYDAYREALAYSIAKLDGGLLAVTSSADWARGDSDGKNIQANAIMYHALVTGAALARSQGDTASAQAWTASAATLKSAVADGGYWDEEAGLYRDKPAGPGASLYPQDGNALAVWFGLVDSPERAATISERLAARWTAVGAPSPEKSAASVHPFPGGMEVHAHFAAGRATTALDLIRREWGYMLNSPAGTASTFWEGYRSDGTSDYSGSYMSAAHGWSTGPTSALTYRLLGIAPAADGGAGHTVVPQPGDCRFADGRLVTAAGVITVAWKRGRQDAFDLTVSAPAAAVTGIGVPVPASGDWTVRLDGRPVLSRRTRAHGVRWTDGYVHLPAPSPGTHRVTVRRG